MKHAYMVIENTKGYLPDNENLIFSNLAELKNYLVSRKKEISEYNKFELSTPIKLITKELLSKYQSVEYGVYWDNSLIHPLDSAIEVLYIPDLSKFE